MVPAATSAKRSPKYRMNHQTGEVMSIKAQIGEFIGKMKSAEEVGKMGKMRKNAFKM